MTDGVARLSERLAGRYTLERELGAGGMATVYLAHDVRHDRKVALKVLRPELAAVIGADRFLQEIKVTANLQHPHILGLIDSGEVDGLLYYVMPYVEGESLRERLTHETQLPIDDAVRITREVASALDYAHRHQVIHRDIKPENILLHDGQALVADFGIALAVSAAGGTRMTETGMSLGTPHYMSPEQAMGEREITARSDVYALGCVSYEMLVGEPPFTGPTAQAIVAKVVTEAPRPLVPQRHTIPGHVEAAVLRALEKLPADRFATAAQFAEALAGRDPALPTTRAAASASSPGSTQWRLRFQLAAGVAVAAGVLAVWGWVRAERDARAGAGATWKYTSLGDSARLAPNSHALALSPDGSILVFRDFTLNSRLFIKRRGDLNAPPIPGTERATNPVFSPDGRWIAFVADGHLRKVRADGGAAISLADSVAGGDGYGGAAWLDDGTLVYVSAGLNDLRRVSAAGGSSTSVLRVPLAGGLGIGFPTALPGARGVLFQACSSGCVTMGVHVLDLRNGTEKLLFTDVAQAWYLPTGHLLYVRRDGAGLLAPFDLRRLEVTGAPVAILEDVQIGFGFAQLAWSPAGALIYARGASGSADRTIVRVGRSGVRAPIDTSWFGAFATPELSPDGQHLAIGVGSAVGGLNIWVKQLDHGPFTRLSFGGSDRRPAWSPDGHLVAFVRDTAGSGIVVARPFDGSGPDRELVRLDRQIQEVTWSRDGRWLLVRTDNTSAGAGDILGVRTGGDATPVPLVATPFTELHPALSPNGHWLAYSSNESGVSELYVRPFPDTDKGRWQISNGGGSEPRWSLDGRELFYLDGAGRLVAAQVAAGSAFAVTALRPLFDVTGLVTDPYHQSYEVSPDGRSFFFVGSRQPGAGAPSPQLVWVDNWFADVRARLRR